MALLLGSMFSLVLVRREDFTFESGQAIAAIVVTISAWKMLGSRLWPLLTQCNYIKTNRSLHNVVCTIAGSIVTSSIVKTHPKLLIHITSSKNTIFAKLTSTALVCLDSLRLWNATAAFGIGQNRPQMSTAYLESPIYISPIYVSPSGEASCRCYDPNLCRRLAKERCKGKDCEH
jgi:hypothetical protein